MSIFGKPMHAKVGLFGEAKAGKTLNATLLACGLLRKLGTGRALKVFDSDGGFDYLVDRIVALTGKEPDGVKANSFVDMLAFTRTCEPDDVVIIDSVSNAWAELFRAAKKRYKFFVSAAGAAKDEWSPFASWVKASPCHVFICGRLAWNYEDAVDEESGKTKSVKTETKMKTENELGYEPSLLLEVSRAQRPDGVLAHEILVKGSRFVFMDGKTYSFLPSSRLENELTYNPVFEVFEPWFDRLGLKTKEEAVINTELKSEELFNTSNDTSWRKELEARKILLEELGNDLFRAWPGQGAKEKLARLDAAKAIFGTDSWEALETNLGNKFNSEALRGMRVALADHIATKKIGQPAEKEV